MKREDTPTVSVSGEEVSSSEEEDEVYSKEPSAVMKPALAAAAATEKQVSESGSDESESEKVVVNLAATREKDFGSGSEDSESVVEDEVVTTKQPKDSRVLKKNQVSKTVKYVTKRARESDEGVSRDVKRVKKVVSEKRKPYFQPLWTEDDVITLLQALVDFRNKTRVSPLDETKKVYLQVKKQISFDCSKKQFMDKLRHLRKKFDKNRANAKNGDGPTFVKDGDHKAFELSKLVWGALEVKSKNVESSSLVRALVCFGLDELDAEKCLSRLSSEDKKIFEEQLKALQGRELNFHLEKARFLHQMLTKMAEGYC